MLWATLYGRYTDARVTDAPAMAPARLRHFFPSMASRNSSFESSPSPFLSALASIIWIVAGVL